MAWFPGIPKVNEDSVKFKELEAIGVQVLCTNRPDIAIKTFIQSSYKFYLQIIDRKNVDFTAQLFSEFEIVKALHQDL